jgi:NitT/TauT family transport system permease protein/putative hydroxymethylpyrimidine transport system permease protein
VRRWLLPTLFLAILIGAWQLAASSGALADLLNLESFVVASPAEIAEALWESRSLLAENAWVTLKEVLIGFGCALIAGVGFAIAMHLSETVRLTFQPLIIASQTIPIVVLAPILVIGFGFGIGPILVIIGLICFFPITVNTLDGLGSVDPEATKMMRTLDASRGQILRRVEMPSALPYFFSGAKIAVAIAVIGAVLGELAAPDSGLGALIFRDMNQLETARAFAAVAILSAMAISLYAILALAERRIVTWR